MKRSTPRILTTDAGMHIVAPGMGAPKFRSPSEGRAGGSHRRRPAAVLVMDRELTGKVAIVTGGARASVTPMSWLWRAGRDGGCRGTSTGDDKAPERNTLAEVLQGRRRATGICSRSPMRRLR